MSGRIGDRARWAACVDGDQASQLLSIGGLAALVHETMGSDPFCGAVYVDQAKRVDRVKLIFWNGTSMVLVSKRL